MKTVIQILSLFLALFYVGVLFAEPVGTLTMEKGTLKLRRNKMDTIYTEPALSIPVENGDEIQTGFDTRANIRMTDPSDTIELFPNTFFNVSGVSREQSELFMPAGKARFLVGNLKKNVQTGRRRFSLRTANAIIGVKGTEFIVGILNGNTNLLTVSGIVSLASISAPEVEVAVSPNRASKIQGNRPPTVPVAVAPDLQQTIINSDSAESFEGVTFGAETAVDDAARSQGTDKGKVGADGAPEVAEIPEQDIDALISDITQEVEQIQADVDDTQSNKRSIEFRIVDQ
ncbi:MAG: FecR family protein [bacterium]